MSKRLEREKKDDKTSARTPSQKQQHGAPNVSSRQGGRHEKDVSGGSDENTTKKQSNSI